MVNGNKYEFTAAYKQGKMAWFQSLLRCTILVFSIIAFQLSTVFAQDIAVGLMNRKTISTFLFSPTDSKYVLLTEGGDTVYVFKSDDAISVSALGARLLVKSPYGLNDTISSLQLVGSGNSPSFRVRFNNEKRDYSYFDKLIVSASGLRH